LRAAGSRSKMILKSARRIDNTSLDSILIELILNYVITLVNEPFN
jgi:hypothetical protein